MNVDHRNISEYLIQ